MRTFNKTALYCSVSALALGLFMPQAQAFDQVDWNWNKDVAETVTIDTAITLDLDPTGMTQVEKLQISLGDKTAVASLEDFTNEPHVNLDENGVLQAVNSRVSLPLVSVSSLAIGNSESITSTVPVLVHEGQFTFGDTSGEGSSNGSIQVPVELAVEGTASGYIDIDATNGDPNRNVNLVGIAGQPDGESLTEGGVAGANGGEDPLVVTGTATGFVNMPVLASSDWLAAENEHTALADTMLSLALGGLITPAQMSATSTVGSVTNAQADVSATSIANNHAIQLDAGSADDAVVVADLVQFSYANNTATASLGSQTISNFSNLGRLADATSSVSAVAGGNISNITVNSFVAPSVEVPGEGGTGNDTSN